MNCILLVDDDEATNEFNTIIIEDVGITQNIKVVIDGQEALDYLQRKGKFSDNDEDECPIPDIIFLDINMPGMNGFEFLEAIENSSDIKLDNTKIFMLTTSIFDRDIERVKQHPEVLEFLNKPLGTEDLGRITQQYF